MMECRGILFLMVSALAMVPAAGYARLAASPFFERGAMADAPTGFDDFCERDRVTCLAGHADRGQYLLAADNFDDPVIGSTSALSDGVLKAQSAVLQMAESAQYSFVGGRRLPAISVSAPDNKPAHEQVRGEAAKWKLLRHINSKVNRSVIQVPDSKSVGMDEYWQRPELNGDAYYGDCEDIAIEKRVRLIEAGYPADDLFFTIAYLPGYGLHVLLVARMNDGDYVMDSLSPRILRKNKVRYSWLRIQSAQNPFIWYRVGPARPVSTPQKPALDKNMRVARLDSTEGPRVFVP